MAVQQPDLEKVFAVIERAVPLLEQLKAAKASAQSYAETLQQYQVLLQEQQDLITSIGVALHDYALEFVALYVPDIEEQVAQVEAAARMSAALKTKGE